MNDRMRLLRDELRECGESYRGLDDDLCRGLLFEAAMIDEAYGLESSEEVLREEDLELLLEMRLAGLRRPSLWE